MTQDHRALDAMRMCFWPWSHRWTKWQDIDARTVRPQWAPEGASTGMAIKQERRCETCNMVQLRTEKTTL